MKFERIDRHYTINKEEIEKQFNLIGNIGSWFVSTDGERLLITTKVQVEGD